MLIGNRTEILKADVSSVSPSSRIVGFHLRSTIMVSLSEETLALAPPN